MSFRPCAVCFETHPEHPGLKLLAVSCERWGWPLRVVHSEWRGWGWRLKRTLAQADRLRREGFTHLVSVDSRDVLAVASPANLISALAHYGNPKLLLATEKASWPIPELANHPKYTSRKAASEWKHGHSPYVLDLTRDFPAGLTECPDDYDDQLFLTELYLADATGDIALDDGCRWMQSVAHCHPWTGFFEVYEDDPTVVPSGRLLNRLTGTKPAFVHGNGKTSMRFIDSEHPQGD